MDPLSEARALLPAWVPWAGPLAHLLLSALLSGLLLRFWAWVLLRPLRRLRRSEASPTPAPHWTEVARLGWAARQAYAVIALLHAVIFGAVSLLWVGPLAVLGPLALGLLSGGAILLIAMEIYRRTILAEALDRAPSFGEMIRGAGVQLLALRPTLTLALVAMALVPAELLSPRGALWLACVVLAMLAAYRGMHLPLLRPLGLVRPAPPRLRALVDRVLEKAEQGRPLRGLFLLRWTMSNALAFPLARMMAFTERSLEAHDDEELEAIAAHELGHLNEPLGARLVRLVPGLLLLVLAASPSLFSAYGPMPVVALVLIFVLVGVLMRRFSRRMESRADEHAQAHDEEVYARALERLHEVNGIPAVMGVKRTHPDLYDRLLALGRPPAYERPAPPPRGATLWSIAGMILVLVLAFGLSLGASLLRLLSDDSELDAEMSLSLGLGDEGRDLALVAFVRSRSSEEEGRALFRAAEQIADLPQDATALRVWSLAERGRCEEAQELWEVTHEESLPEVLMTADWESAELAMIRCRSGAGPEE